MGLIYNLKLFEAQLHNKISISVTFFMKDDNEWHTEFIQGILKEVDLVSETITIKQYFTYYDFLHKLETESKIRVFKSGEFFMISCGNMTAK